MSSGVSSRVSEIGPAVDGLCSRPADRHRLVHLLCHLVVAQRIRMETQGQGRGVGRLQLGVWLAGDSLERLHQARAQTTRTGGSEGRRAHWAACASWWMPGRTEHQPRATLLAKKTLENQRGGAEGEQEADGATSLAAREGWCSVERFAFCACTGCSVARGQCMKRQGQPRLRASRRTRRPPDADMCAGGPLSPGWMLSRMALETACRTSRLDARRRCPKGGMVGVRRREGKERGAVYQCREAEKERVSICNGRRKSSLVAPRSATSSYCASSVS